MDLRPARKPRAGRIPSRHGPGDLESFLIHPATNMPLPPASCGSNKTDPLAAAFVSKGFRNDKGTSSCASCSSRRITPVVSEVVIEQTEYKSFPPGFREDTAALSNRTWSSANS